MGPGPGSSWSSACRIGRDQLGLSSLHRKAGVDIEESYDKAHSRCAQVPGQQKTSDFTESTLLPRATADLNRETSPEEKRGNCSPGGTGQDECPQSRQLPWFGTPALPFHAGEGSLTLGAHRPIAAAM